MTRKTDLISRFKMAHQALSARLIGSLAPDNLWRGRLSSSAVSTSVAALAMSLEPLDQPRMLAAVNWLCDNANKDGGWGDTPASASNLSAVMLARAALINSAHSDDKIRRALHDSQQWLLNNIGGGEGEILVDNVLRFYGKDLTFSVPILTVSMLSGALGKDAGLWRKIPALPFELSLIPGAFYRLMRLPVVSYAIPALIAVGIAHHRQAMPDASFLWRLRKKAVRPAMHKLTSLMPANGGFLEAAPLTSFVAFCLGKSGLKKHVVAQKGLEFLRANMRSDGSWPIDTDLAMWLTSLTVDSLSGQIWISRDHQKSMLLDNYRKAQTRQINVFTGAAPGGWAWTDLPGGVPDADDTSGALVAMSQLMPGDADSAVESGLTWLLNLQNSDGGIPTFCRGWGYLPFDRSCPDISAHALKAFSLWKNRTSSALARRLDCASAEILRFLHTSRDQDGVWSPLWFGDQDANSKKNRVYGTSVVLEALSYHHSDFAKPLVETALVWLKSAQNSDGGFGGDPGVASKVETTAKALSAMALYETDSDALVAAGEYIISRMTGSDIASAAPIGLYFSSLWYDEKLYPLIFAVKALKNLLYRLENHAEKGRGGSHDS